MKQQKFTKATVKLKIKKKEVLIWIKIRNKKKV